MRTGATLSGLAFSIVGNERHCSAFGFVLASTVMARLRSSAVFVT
jgi:hypothetical protein